MDGDGDYDMLFASGTRDASIWDTDLNLIAHTADDFEQLSAEVCPQAFNADPGRFSPISESFDSESNERVCRYIFVYVSLLNWDHPYNKKWPYMGVAAM